MDTYSFLNTILPRAGVKFAVRIKPRPGTRDVTILHPAGDADDLAEQVLALDTQYAEHNVYYAMASYKEVKYSSRRQPDGRDFEFPTGRTQDNVLALKATWFDMDVGKEGAYETQRAAVKDLLNYCAKIGLPTPIVVSSGYGVHCYWPYTASVEVAEWEEITRYQRAAWRHMGLKVDPACDQDCARILRAPGTHNRKAGKDPRLVRIIRKHDGLLTPMEHKRLLRAYVEQNALTVQVKVDTPEWAKGFVGGNLDGAVPEYPDSYAEIAVNHCSQMQEFKATGGSSEPIWYANIGLLKHFKDGAALAHTWSANYDGYDADETDTKMAQWSYGPTTCAKFKDVNPTGCEGCTRTCRSPVQLGQDEKVTPPNVVELEAAAAKPLPEAKPAAENGLPEGWPERYGYSKALDSVTMKVRDADGVFQDVPIATPLFYPVEQIRDEEGTYCFRIHAWIRGVAREFLMPTKHIADHRSMKMHLAANRVVVKNDKATGDFLASYMLSMQNTKEETETYRQMGWQHDQKAWLIGDALITEKETRRVVLSKNFSAERRTLYDPKGDPNQWVHTVNTLFNREHGEPYQFAICAAFAAPLHSLMGFSEWRGIPFALTTDESGFGKTTVNMIANSIWYDPEKGKISNSTAKAVTGIASEFNNLPFLLDEVTSYLKDPSDMGDLMYSMSNGRAREGMDGGGKLRNNLPPWTGVCGMTGNRNIFLQVSENKLNPEAMQMRVFEIDLDTYPRIATMEKGTPEYANHNAEHRLLAQTLVSECSGVIGTEYIRFVMKHKDAIKAQLRKVSIGMAEHMEDGDATKERFYYHLVTTVLVGGLIAKKMGYINFDMKNLRQWCIGHVKRLRNHVKDNRRTPQDHFSAMMSDMVGRLIITTNYDSLDARKGITQIHKGGPLRTPVCGRYVTGDQKERTQLYITVSAVQDWCVENGLAYNSFRRDLLNEGFIRLANKNANRNTGAVRISIGKGVDGIHELGAHMCLEIHADKVAGVIPTVAPVTELKQKEEIAA